MNDIRFKSMGSMVLFGKDHALFINEALGIIKQVLPEKTQYINLRGECHYYNTLPELLDDNPEIKEKAEAIYGKTWGH